MNFLTAALVASLTALFTLTAFGGDALIAKNEITRKLNRSAVLLGVQAGVKKDYGLNKCTRFELTDESSAELIQARSICTFRDKWGNESGVLIEVEGVIYEGSESFMLNAINFRFAG